MTIVECFTTLGTVTIISLRIQMSGLASYPRGEFQRKLTHQLSSQNNTYGIIYLWLG